MMKTNDPRFWGKVAASGGVRCNDPLVQTVQRVRGSLNSGAKTVHDPATHKFDNVGKVLNRMTHLLGQRMMSH